MTIFEAAAGLRAGTYSSVELTQQCLAKIDPNINAFITVLDQPALAEAAALDAELAAGIDRGPLHGIPIAHKDLFCTKGIRTTSGSMIFSHHVPDHDATVVDRLHRAGTVLLGKTGMHELAYGITSNNPHYGAVRNPNDLERIAGGSSGGSAAAVGAGMAFAAMGSDTGGSIRIPASFCGVVGLKPTYGRVSRFGALPLAFSLDHIGPLTRSVKDAAILLGLIAGHDPNDAFSSRRAVDAYLPPEDPSLKGLRVGFPDNYYLHNVDPEVADAVRAAFYRAESLGAQIVRVPIPDIDALNSVARVILLVEAAAALRPYHHRREEFGVDVLALLDQGRLISGIDYVDAQRLRGVMARKFALIWQQVDCLMTPATPTIAPKIGQTTIQIGTESADVRLATTRFMRGINALGIPALSIPCGHSHGLPIGLQILGPAFSEAIILRLGAALEAY